MFPVAALRKNPYLCPSFGGSWHPLLSLAYCCLTPISALIITCPVYGLLRQKQIISFKAHANQCNVILTNYTCKDPIFKEGQVLRSNGI
jgi:hypothetical protein